MVSQALMLYARQRSFHKRSLVLLITCPIYNFFHIQNKIILHFERISAIWPRNIRIKQAQENAKSIETIEHVARSTNSITTLWPFPCISCCMHADNCKKCTILSQHRSVCALHDHRALAHCDVRLYTYTNMYTKYPYSLPMHNTARCHQHNILSPQQKHIARGTAAACYSPHTSSKSSHSACCCSTQCCA